VLYLYCTDSSTSQVDVFIENAEQAWGVDGGAPRLSHSKVYLALSRFLHQPGLALFILRLMPCLSWFGAVGGMLFG
jgi:hypothetical protein